MLSLNHNELKYDIFVVQGLSLRSAYLVNKMSRSQLFWGFAILADSLLDVLLQHAVLFQCQGLVKWHKIEAAITKFRPKMQNNLVKVLLLFEVIELDLQCQI